MSTLSEFNRQSDVLIDGEHQIQLDMLSALCNVLQECLPPPGVGEILQKLVAYSAAHFMSEELLMRLNSFDDYEGHVSDHIRLMGELERLAAAHASGDATLVTEGAGAVFNSIRQHIATRDQRLAEFLNGGLYSI